mmetsp:Transcript_17884/g.17954  ORF Transcript_17884/g.17954 Transcript_17884/m.17954 type:complete len:121 (+) Transcript_17884:77-439(+)
MAEPTETVMRSLAEGVEFNTIAREWRFKWSPDNDKQSLVAAQNAFIPFLYQLKALDGLRDVQRIVCGGCYDYKIIIALTADKFSAWADNEFAPEKDYLTQISTIPGLSCIETQNYTIMRL